MKKIILLGICNLLLLTSIYGQCVRSGPFLDGPEYDFDGTVSMTFLLNGTNTLSFDSNFNTEAGPELHVYLSNTTTVTTSNGILTTPNAIDLGELQSNSGAQSYTLPIDVNLNSYDYVVIHCAPFNHYWGTATLGTEAGNDCSTILNVSEFENPIFDIYPNPIPENHFYVHLKRSTTAILKMYDITGKTIRKPIFLSEEKNKIGTYNLKEGIYILKVISENTITSKKILIQ